MRWRETEQRLFAFVPENCNRRKKGLISGQHVYAYRLHEYYTSFNRVLCLSSKSLLTASFVIGVSSPIGQASPIHMYGFVYIIAGFTAQQQQL